MLFSTSIAEQDENQVVCWATVRIQNLSMLIHQVAYQHVCGAQCACLPPTPVVKTLLMSLFQGGWCTQVTMGVECVGYGHPDGAAEHLQSQVLNSAAEGRDPNIQHCR